MLTPVAGEIRAVSGGHGLMLVLQYDEKEGAAEMRGHGPAKGGHWFPVNRLSKEAYGEAVVLKERAEAHARRVACNSPDCWCRKFVKDALYDDTLRSISERNRKDREP